MHATPVRADHICDTEINATDTMRTTETKDRKHTTAASIAVAKAFAGSGWL